MSIPASVRSILVYVGLDRVGDGLLKLPFVRGLRTAWPEARITWLAGKDTSVYAGALKGQVAGLIDEVIERAEIGLRASDLVRRPLPGRAFDLIFDTQRVALASLVLHRIRHRALVSPFANFALSSVKPPRGYSFPAGMQRQLLDLLEIATGVPHPTPHLLEVAIDPGLRATAARLLPDGPIYVGLSPGAGGLPKCWPLANFAAVAKRQAGAGRVPVFILGPAEAGWDAELRAAVPEAKFPLQDENEIGARLNFAPELTIALAGRLAVAVSNDSGTGHMLAVGGAPMVSLYGRTVAEKFLPMTDRLTIIRAQDFGGRELSFIPVDAVARAVEATLTAHRER
jgi:ADP-heptose:LPS heptosyltransferase